MKACGFEKEVERVEKGRCPTCNKPVDFAAGFRDALSRKEFGISGMCQQCQDEVFGV